MKLLLACRLDPERDSSDRGVTLSELLDAAQLQWPGVKPDHPDWRSSSHTLCLTARAPRLKRVLHVMLNAY